MSRIKQCEARGGGSRGKERTMRVRPIETARHLRRKAAALAKKERRK